MLKCDTCFLLFYNKSNRKAETFSQSNANTWACVITELLHTGYIFIQLDNWWWVSAFERKIWEYSVNMQCCGLYTSLDQVKCLK